MTTTRNIYALLVGIDSYLGSVPALQGCVNDITAIENYLRERIDTKKYQINIKKLLNEQATRKAIIEGFEKHLEQAESKDIALFYYSGHGSQEPTPPEFWHLEPDRMDETIVCYDSREEGGWDLADKELAYLISKVAEKDPQIVLIMDCCHSGSGTRDTVPKQGLRHSPADKRARKIEDYICPFEDTQSFIKIPTSGASEIPRSGWKLQAARHIVLASCQDLELASEYSGNGQQRGAFSYFLLDTLQKTNGSLTYRELFKRANALVRSHVKDQSPQIEAIINEDLDRPFLGFSGEEAIAQREPYFTLSCDRDGRWVIDGGAVHGIPQSGADSIRLALYPQGSNAEQMKRIDRSVGEVEITQVLPQKSFVNFIAEPENLSTDTVLNAIIISQSLPPLPVYFEGDEEAIVSVRQQLHVVAPGEKPSLYVKEVEGVSQAKFRVLARDREYLITKPADHRPLVEQLSYSQSNALKTVKRLEHIARWTTIASLSSSGSSRILPDGVKMSLYRTNGEEIKETQLRLEYEYSNGKWQSPRFQVKLVNTTNQRLYCTLLDLTEQYSVSAPFFGTGGTWIEPNEEVWGSITVSGQRTSKIPTSVPKDLWEQGITEYQDILKLLVCTAEFDPTLLTQEKLDKPRAPKTRDATGSRNSTLNRLMNRVTSRDIGEEEVEEIDEWVTSEIAIVTVRPPNGVGLSSEVPVSLGANVVLESHPSLKAQARLTNVSQATRDVGSHILPPILRENTQPFQFTASRGTDSGLSALELQVKEGDTATLNTVTPDAPLKLSVDRSLGEGEYILPVAYDGEFFLPLGHGGTKQDGKTEITIERLPQPVSKGKRSVSGAIRIFFQKVVTAKLGKELSNKLGLKLSYPILAAVDVEDGRVNYLTDEETVKQRVARSQKIVLYIHGIFGDTQSMVPSAETAIATVDGVDRPLKEVYDLVLTFDYESINTSISQTALKLKEKLTAVGLEAGHGKTLHIVAHSMGGLVSRWLIEREQGEKIVQHLIMLGTPNAGSPWSQVQAGLTIAVTFALNNLSTFVLPLKTLGIVLEQIEKIGVALDEMDPKSEMLQKLAKSDPTGVPYTLVAGNVFEIPMDAKSSLRKRLSQKLKDIMGLPFFGTPHDLAVTVESITSIPKTIQPEPQIQEIACDHFSYFVNPIGLKALGSAAAIAASCKTSALDRSQKKLSIALVIFSSVAAIALGLFLWQKSQVDYQDPEPKDLDLPGALE